MPSMKLYSVPTANGQRAAIALEEAGIEYQVKPVDLRAGEHRSPEMLALNPFGRMPVLEIPRGGEHPQVVYGSLAIGQYAAAQSGRLVPDTSRMADMHHWLGIVMTDLAPAFAAQFYLGVLAPEPDPWALDLYTDIVLRFLDGIDEHLANSQYFVGTAYTLADVMMYPTAATSTARLDGGLERWPGLARWAGEVGQRAPVLRGMSACPGSL